MGFIAPPTPAQRRRREAFVEGLLARLPIISFDAVAARITPGSPRSLQRVERRSVRTISSSPPLR